MRRYNARDCDFLSGNTSTNKNLMYQHMSSHYRRILNAKKTIDTSPPRYFKIKCSNPSPSESPSRSASPCKKSISRNTSPALTERSISTNSYGGSCWETESYASKKDRISRLQQTRRAFSLQKPTNSDMELIDRITFDTKYPPAAYCNVDWVELKTKHKEPAYKSPYESKKTRNASVTNGKRRSFNKNKVIPQKRKWYLKLDNEDSSRTPVSGGLDSGNCKCTEICICGTSECKCTYENLKEQSQTSSRDSAYNGGVSSLPESRSPTPDQRKPTDINAKQLAYETTSEGSGKKSYNRGIDKSIKYVKTLDAIDDELLISAPNHATSVKDRSVMFNTSSERDRVRVMRDVKEEALYTKLIKDITQEILEKGLFTNRALKKIMRNHVAANLQTLNKERMLAEVDNLRRQLGVPDEESPSDSLSPLESSLESRKEKISEPKEKYSSKEVKEIYEEDESEYSSQMNSRMAVGKKSNPMPKSISDVMRSTEGEESRTDTDEEVSVVKVSQTIRKESIEKDNSSIPSSYLNKKLTNPNREDSADESEQSREVRSKRKRTYSKPKVPDKLSTSSEDDDDDGDNSIIRRHDELIQIEVADMDEAAKGTSKLDTANKKVSFVSKKPELDNLSSTSSSSGEMELGVINAGEQRSPRNLIIIAKPKEGSNVTNYDEEEQGEQKIQH